MAKKPDLVAYAKSQQTSLLAKKKKRPAYERVGKLYQGRDGEMYAKVTYYIADDQHRELKAMAASRGLGVSEMLRDIVREYLVKR